MFQYKTQHLDQQKVSSVMSGTTLCFGAIQCIMTMNNCTSVIGCPYASVPVELYTIYIH